MPMIPPVGAGAALTAGAVVRVVVREARVVVAAGAAAANFVAETLSLDAAAERLAHAYAVVAGHAT